MFEILCHTIHIDFSVIGCGSSNAVSVQLSRQIPHYIVCTCTAFLRSAFLSAFSDPFYFYMLCSINCSCMVYPQCGSLCGQLGHAYVQMLCHINCTCTAFLQCGFLCAFEDCLEF